MTEFCHQMRCKLKFTSVSCSRFLLSSFSTVSSSLVRFSSASSSLMVAFNSDTFFSASSNPGKEIGRQELAARRNISPTLQLPQRQRHHYLHLSRSCMIFDVYRIENAFIKKIIPLDRMIQKAL